MLKTYASLLVSLSIFTAGIAFSEDAAPATESNGEPAAPLPPERKPDPWATTDAAPKPPVTNQAAEPAEKKPETKDASGRQMSLYWKDGIRMETEDKSIRFQLGGRVMLDAAWISARSGMKDVLTDIDGVAFRRARIALQGFFGETLGFKSEFDFASGSAQAADVYFNVSKLPKVGNLRIGHQKEPFGLEELTSSNYITFMERSLTSAFIPARNVGLQIFNTDADEKMTWALGLFRETSAYGYNTNKSNSLTGRVTFLPTYEDEGKKLLHLGFAFNRRYIDGSVNYSARPENYLASNYVSTGWLPAEDALTFGFEAAVVRGPLSVQSEFMFARPSIEGAGDPFFISYYLCGGYFLTGEQRNYKRSAGVFDRVKPLEDFGADSWGAFELTARYSLLDLSDRTMDGGRISDITVGANWYMNSNMRAMLNLIRARVTNYGFSYTLASRVQVDF